MNTEYCSELEQACRERDYTLEIISRDAPTPDGWPAGTVSMRVRLWLENDETMEVSWHQGPAHEADPTVADVLSAVASDALSVEDGIDYFAANCMDQAPVLVVLETFRKCEAMAKDLDRAIPDWRESLNLDH